MKLKNEGAQIFIPDEKSVDEALKRTTHMAIAAHQDDIEIMAYDGILKCFGKDDKWFAGVVVTNGSGSARDGIYASFTDEQMQQIRKLEQKKAAFVGEYGAQILLDYPSSAVKSKDDKSIKEELKEIIMMAKPDVIYTHNLADKHDTHVAVISKVIKTLRELKDEFTPKELYGCEVWRALDWMNDEDKIRFDVGGRSNIENALLGVFDSQICGGKRYDLATAGRRLANATYAESHETDATNGLIYAMDLMPLILDKKIDINEYVQGYIKRFSMDVESRISKFFPRSC